MKLLSFWAILALMTQIPSVASFAQSGRPGLNKVRYSQLSLESAIYALSFDQGQLLTFPEDAKFYMKARFNSASKDADLAFGSVKDPYDGNERVSYGEKSLRVRAAFRMGPRLILLDSSTRQFQIWNDDFKSFQQPMDIILDSALPPRDAGGEAPRAEQASLKKKISSALSREKRDPDLIAGLAEIPPSWKAGDGAQYLLWLRLPDAPLFTLSCDLKGFRVCQVKRACVIRGLSPSQIVDVRGIAIEPSSDQLLILRGDSIDRLKGKSCGRLQHEPAYDLPQKDVRSLLVDSERRLWLGLSRPEDASSASVLAWEARDWLK